MVTKQDLLNDAESDRALAAAAQRARDQERAATEERWQRERCAWATTALAGTLGGGLRRWNKTYKAVKLDYSRVWDLKGHEIYDAGFNLGFEPAPDYAPTKVLLAKLKEAGFEARVDSVEEQNYEWHSDADGGGAEPVPGTHTVHYLVIIWG